MKLATTSLTMGLFQSRHFWFTVSPSHVWMCNADETVKAKTKLLLTLTISDFTHVVSPLWRDKQFGFGGHLACVCCFFHSFDVISGELHVWRLNWFGMISFLLAIASLFNCFPAGSTHLEPRVKLYIGFRDALWLHWNPSLAIVKFTCSRFKYLAKHFKNDLNSRNCFQWWLTSFT